MDTSDTSPMDTGEMSSSYEKNLLDYEDDVIVNKRRAIERPWKKWKEGDKQILKNHLDYHIKNVEYINKCWASGPNKNSPPKKPESDLEDLVKKG